MSSNSGSGAQAWGLWRVDPGPRAVRLSSFEKLRDAGGVAPAGWKFDESDWWLEEHGLIMEAPLFPVPPGSYVAGTVTDIPSGPLGMRCSDSLCSTGVESTGLSAATPSA